MSSDYGDIRNSLINNSQDDSNNFITSHVEHLEGRTNTEYNNAFRVSPSSNKPVISVARRNERERKRVRLVNQGFAILRDRVPRDRCSRGRRSSKVETLRAAIMYIRQLQQLLLESQIRYQEQDVTSCYGYVTDDSYLNSSVSSVCDTYAVSNGYPQSFTSSPPYPHLRTNAGVPSSNTWDRHLAVPWFT